MARDPRYVALINSLQWRKTRRHKLSMQPLCERCAERGEIKEATEVHHITPVESARDADTMRSLAYDPHNLRSLCHDCHALTHKELKSRGKQATGQRNKDSLARFRNKFLGGNTDAPTDAQPERAAESGKGEKDNDTDTV